ncbi:MAG: hypothetical protein K0S32_4074 [Bacteroidetes bacterium]|jgi:hypothetical protein|nr:hypothetical protein [Bacteroidota bacterium]
MKLKLRHTFIFLFAASSGVFSQGIVNNGAQINFSGAGQIYIDGNGNGDYLSQAGGIVNPSATGIITMEGDWTNNSANTGFGSDNGTVVMNGANQTINGTSSTTFYNLTLQGSGTKTQNLNTSVGGVTTTNGVLSVGNVIYSLNSFVLTMRNPAAAGITYGTGYILSETNAAVNPSILRWNMNTSTGAHVIPFGVAGTQIPFTFNKTTAGASNIDVSTRATAASDNLPWAGASNVGAVSFFYCPNNGMSGNPCASNSVVDRWWDITPSAAVTANVTFSYRGSENTLNAPYNTGNLGAQYWDGSYWNLDNATYGSAAAVTAGVGAVTANGLSQFCPYVLSSVSVPLPMQLIDFVPTCSANNGAVLNWSTATEKNGSHFAIMNSNDGVSFTRIATVNAKGNSGSVTKYSYTIPDKNKYGNYYRLKMVDTDLSAKDSKIEFLSPDCQVKNDLNVYYSSQTGVVVTATSSDETINVMTIYDAAGRLVRTNDLQFKAGYNNFNIDPQLANGVYLVSLQQTAGTILSKKIVICN